MLDHEHPNWEDDFPSEAQKPPDATMRGLLRARRYFLPELILLAIIAGVVWWIQVGRVQFEEQAQVSEIQNLLDQERTAVLAGDGDAFFRMQADDAAWQAAQLHPTSQARIRRGEQVIGVDAFDTFVRVAVGTNETYRYAFFRERAGQYTHMPTAPKHYWGAQWREVTSWGALVYFAADEPYKDLLIAQITALIDEICAADCQRDQFPLTILIADRMYNTASPNTTVLPSPQLVALETDAPGSEYWSFVRSELSRFLLPVTLRFAVLPLPNRPTVHPILDLPALANAFHSENPRITVELILLTEPPTDLHSLAREYDGALFAPTPDMLTAGVVQDLTGFAFSDPEFRPENFYPQAWAPVEWRGRMWWVPLAMHLPVIFYDRAAFSAVGLDEPTTGWTWETYFRVIDDIVSADSISDGVEWSMLDPDYLTLQSYARALDNRCQAGVQRGCVPSAADEHIAEAITWYAARVGRGILPDNVDLQAFEPSRVVMNYQGATRTAALWVDSPVNYENQALLAGMGVLPFPGETPYSGVMPVEVYGGFVSAYSDVPHAVWKWLSFLSNQRPAPRLLPARPTVATTIGYWERLPAPLAEPLQYGFSNAVAVSSYERERLSLAVESVLAGEQDAFSAWQHAPNIRWFEGDREK